MIVKSYQAQRRLAAARPARPQFAVVAAVEPAGVLLRFPDGQTGRKHYKTAAQYSPKVGDRVHLLWRGTYVADYSI